MIQSLVKFIKNMSPSTGLTESYSESNIKIINGTFNTSHSTVTEQLKINGAATLGPKTIITKPIVINGQLETNGAVIENEIAVNGTAEINHSTFKSKSQFSGNMSAQESQFLETINLLMNEAVFTHCAINQIVIKTVALVRSKQKIYLKNNCIISGDITFESGHGEVWLDSSSQLQGKIHGGKIVIM